MTSLVIILRGLDEGSERDSLKYRAIYILAAKKRGGDGKYFLSSGICILSANCRPFRRVIQYAGSQKSTFSPSVKDSLSRAADSLSGMKRALSALREGPEGDVQAIQELVTARQKLETEGAACRNAYLSLALKGQFYAICALTGNVLSIATVIGLVALGILNTALGVLAAALFTWQAAVSGNRLYESNKAIKAVRWVLILSQR